MTSYSIVKTSLGELVLVANQAELIGVYFYDCRHVPTALKTWTRDDQNALLKKAAKEINEYLDGKRSIFTFPLGSAGTDFQKKVWKEIAKIPFGKTISLRAKANDKWIIAENNGLVASGIKCGAAQQFKVIDQSAGYWHGVVALQSADNQLYVTADPAGALPLAGKTSTVGPNELFQWIDNGDGTISLRSLANSLAVSVNSSGTGYLVSTAINPAQDGSFVVK